MIAKFYISTINNSIFCLSYFFGNDVFTKFCNDVFAFTLKFENLGNVVSEIMHHMQVTAQLKDVTDANKHINKGRDYSIIISWVFIQKLQGAGLKIWQTTIGVRIRPAMLIHSIKSTFETILEKIPSLRLGWATCP